MSLRVLHVITQKPGHTGSGIYLRSLLNEAEVQGHETACVVGVQEHEECDLENGFPVVFETQGLPFPVVGMSDVMPYRSSLWSLLTVKELALYRRAFKLQMQAAVETFQPDVIHCHHFWLLTALVREHFPFHRVVASCHGTGLRQGQNLPKLWDMASIWLRQIDHGYALTREQARHLPLGPDRISVVGAGFDSRVFYPRSSSRTDIPRVLFVGKLSRSKGCWELLDALEALASERLEVHFAGDGHGEEAEIIKTRALAMGVKLHGRISQSELSGLMRQSSVMVLPSYYEGLPLVLAEALSSGCRVVVNGLPGILDWLPEEVKSSPWIHIVEMPKLVGPDRPVQSDLPAYVSRLRRGLQEQLATSCQPSEALNSFLAEQSWSGVYHRIAEHYRVPS